MIIRKERTAELFALVRLLKSIVIPGNPVHDAWDYYFIAISSFAMLPSADKIHEFSFLITHKWSQPSSVG